MNIGTRLVYRHKQCQCAPTLVSSVVNNAQALASGTSSSNLGVSNVVQKRASHITNKINRREPTRNKILDKFAVTGKPSDIKREKEKYLKEVMEARRELSGIFGEQARTAILKDSEDRKLEMENQKKSKAIVCEALRMYRMLRPEAPAFYKEDSMLTMEAKMNALLLRQSPAAVKGGASTDALDLPTSDVPFDPLQFNLPVVNPTAFVLALEAATRSLTADLRYMCEALEVPSLPAEEDPLAFKKCLDALLDSFKLRKDPSYAASWVVSCWPRLRPLLPEELADLPDEVITDWLRGHLERVIKNQAADKEINLHKATKALDDGLIEWYNFGEDFIYDDYPLPRAVVEERNTDFPIHKAKEYLMNFAGFFQLTKGETPVVTEEVGDQFQQLVHDLDKIGLKSWLNMDVKELETFLPQGEIPALQGVTPDDYKTAELMLKAAARGKANLLEFDALDPYKLLHMDGEGGMRVDSVQEELGRLPQNDYLTDKQIEEMFDLVDAKRVLSQPDIQQYQSEQLKAFVKQHKATPLELLIEQEKDFYKTIGPADWKENADGEFAEWKWKKPANTIYDPRRDRYVREQDSVDPNIRLDSLRQTLLDIGKMAAMTTNGRVFYYRAIVAVGNGRGLFGVGIGFGNTPKDARADASVKALQKLEFVDLDPGRSLATPVAGMEYTASCKILPRPMNKGLKCNNKFLPLCYLIGLDNVFLRFPGKNKTWFSRVKALRRALDSMQSRRTIANATGKKYALLVAPGDHWVHWPDRWFRPIYKDYFDKYNRIRQMRPAKYLKGYRATIDDVTPADVKPDLPYYMWKTPLQKLASEQKRNRQLKTTPFKTEVLSSPDALEVGRKGSEFLVPAAPGGEIPAGVLNEEDQKVLGGN